MKSNCVQCVAASKSLWVQRLVQSSPCELPEVAQATSIQTKIAIILKLLFGPRVQRERGACPGNPCQWRLAVFEVSAIKSQWAASAFYLIHRNMFQAQATGLACGNFSLMDHSYDTQRWAESTKETGCVCMKLCRRNSDAAFL